jgi:enoyl-CoA hydratase
MPDEPSTVLLERSGAVATVTLSRPEALNAITREMLLELGATLDGIAADVSVRVVKALAGVKLDDGAVGDFLDIPARAAITTITTMPQVVIARVNGFCFTGALEVVLACDMVVAAAEAKLGDTHAKWGLRPTWGMSQRLVRAVGITRARELSLTARTFTGTEAAAWGLATCAVPLVELDAAVDELARAVTAGSPGSVAAYKDLFLRSLDEGLAAGLDYEASTIFDIADTEERISGFR